MIIILVGPPGVGKSRLAKLLGERGYTIRYPANPNSISEQDRWVWAVKELGIWSRGEIIENMVYDGFPYPDAMIHPGEIINDKNIVYGMWDVALDSVNAIVVYLQPEYPSYLSRRYEKWLELTHCHHLTITVNDTINDVAADAVLEFVRYTKILQGGTG